MPINQAALDDVRTVLLSCLLARKGLTPLPVLERDFYDLEKKRIPYRQFGYSDLASFIQSMPDHFSIELYRGNTCVRGIASEKTQHIKSLVDRQKADNKRYVSSHSRQFYPSHNRRQHKSQRVRISHEKLSDLISYIQKSPTGVSLNVASTYVQCLVPYVEVNKEDLREQLRELTHLLNLDGNMIYPILSNDLPSTSSHSQSFMEKPSLSQSWDPSELRNDSASPPTKQTECAAGQEDDLYCSEENDFVPAGCRITRTQKRTKTSEHLATNVAYYAQSEQTDKFSYKVQNDSEISEDECFASTDSKNNITLKTQDVYNIISNRTISRLEKLLQKHPEGIWCAELPDLYYNEYNVPLNYTVLGFASVREFTFYLPKIFYMTQVNKTDDFLLFNADKRPVVPKTESTDMTQSSNKRYDKHNKVQEYNNNNEEPIPSDISPDVVKRFAPDDAMSYNDNVEKISVVELKKTKTHLEVYVIEVFHPSFFWIHLRENRKRFFKMMDELSKFYEHNKDSYAIPKVALKKDLNCACIYMNKWHRGLIKSVKPDYRVTIFFYDYGTLKTYVAEDIYYLHKQFSTLSAQAIPCGLYNVKPTTIGERWKKSVVAQFIDKIEETLLAATIMSVDEKENSMLVNLYDTSEEEDVNITNWLVYEKLALIGKTADAVDMASLMKYVLNNLNQLPTYCFAEENPMSDSLIRQSECKVTPTEKHVVPPVSPGPTLPLHDNHPQQPVRPPPGFLPLSDQRILSNASPRDFHNDYSFTNMLNANTPIFGNTEPTPTKNPFLAEQQFVPGDMYKHYMSVIDNNKKLQLKVNEILHDLLERSSLSFDDHVQLNKMLQIIEDSLSRQKNKAVVKTSSASNFTSGTTSNVSANLAQKTSYNLSSDTFARQELNSNTFSMSNPFGMNGNDRPQNNATCFTYDKDGFAFKTNWSQSGDVSPCMQMPPSTTPSPTPSMFVNHVPPTNIFSPKVSQENVPLVTSVPPAAPTSVGAPTNVSEILDNVNVQFTNMLKDTNPFKVSMTGIHIPETQNERRDHNYDAKLASYLSASNSQSHPSKTETANIHPRNNCFMPAGHASENYTSKIVYESGPVMYNTQSKRAGVDARLSACNYDNVQNAQFLELGQYNMKSTSQPANTLHTQHKTINDQMTREQVNGYVTQPSTYYMQNSQSVTNHEPYYQQYGNANNLPSSTQSWNSEYLVNSKFQNSVPLSNCNENTSYASSVTLPQDWSYYNRRNSIEKEATDSYTSSWPNTESIQHKNVASNNNFLFQQIDSVKGITFLFNIEQDGWILTDEFVETFTNLKLHSQLLATIETLNIKIVFKEIQRSDYPIQFSQLDRYPLKVPRDSEKRIISINLISLQNALTLLHKLKIISRDEIDKAFKRNEFLEGSVLPTLWTLIVNYRDLKRRIELCSNYMNV
ncbi:uncharacterized protein LOC105195977 isoform X1 [Solenopsis invicta]|uniref:uncharacterized protein LOC105195977 isoform X1 n=1 Tax=Solenopsis invicta TaxID=13686 RepID=UPI00193E076A|nr:uncharacterized protein LOC105195977 isoform X1 [Solenopsis invicta]